MKTFQVPMLPVITTTDRETSLWANRMNSELVTSMSQIQEAIDNLNAIGYFSKDPTGFANTNTDSTISFDDATRTFTIAASDEYIPVFYKGDIAYLKGSLSIQIDGTEGLHHIYFDENGELGITNTFDEDLLSEKIYIAAVYWDAVNNKHVYLGDERHGLMPWYIHILWHQTFGTSFISGGAVSLTAAPDSNGSSNTHVTFSVTDCIIRDEDIKHEPTGYTAPASPGVWYKTGAALWREAPGPLLLNGSSVPYFNEYTGGVWQLTAVDNTKFFLMHLFAINDAARGFQLILGEAQYDTINDARLGANDELSDLILTGMPSAEFSPIATIIYQTNTAYTNSYNARIRSTDSGEDFIDWRFQELTPGQGPGSHTNLTDRDAVESHPATAILVDTSSFDYIDSLATDVQLALDDIDDILLALSPILPAAGIVTEDSWASFDPAVSGGASDSLVKKTYTWSTTGLSSTLEMRLYCKVGATWHLLTSVPADKGSIVEGTWTEFNTSTLEFVVKTGECIVPAEAEEIEFRLFNTAIGTYTAWTTAPGADDTEDSFVLPEWFADVTISQDDTSDVFEVYTWPTTGSPDWSGFENKLSVEFQAQISGTWVTIHRMPWTAATATAIIDSSYPIAYDVIWPASASARRIAASYAAGSLVEFTTSATATITYDDLMPDAPTNVDQQFIESGNWDDANLVPDEEDLTQWDGYGSATLTVGYSTGWSTLTCAAGGYEYIKDAIDPGVADTVLISFLAQGDGTGDEFQFVYIGFTSPPYVADLYRIPIINSDTLIRRYVATVPVFDRDSHLVQFESEASVSVGSYIKVSGVRVIPYSFRPSLSLIERWTWTEHANAANTVDRYELVRVYPSGYTQILASAPVGSTYLQAATFSGGSSWNELNGTEIKLRVVGKAGGAVLMDSDTQSIASWTLGDPMKDFRDVDTTAIAAGSLLKVAADGDTHEYLAQGSGGGLDADTLDGTHLSGVALSGHDHDSDYLGLAAKAADSDKLDGRDSIDYRQSRPYPYVGSVCYALVGTYSGGAATKVHVETTGGYIYNNGLCKTECLFGFGNPGVSEFAYSWSLWGGDLVNRTNVVVYDNGDNTWSVYLKNGVWGNGMGRAVTYTNNTPNQGGQITGLAANGKVTEIDTNANWTATAPTGTLVFDSGAPATYPPHLYVDAAGSIHMKQGSSLEMTDAGGTKRTMLRSPAAGELWVGEDVTTIRLEATTRVTLDRNNLPLQGLTTGSAWVNLLKLNTSNDAEVGNAASGLRLLGDETRPQYNGGNLALSADLSSYSLTTHDHDTSYVAKSQWTAKGALMAASAAGTPAVLTVGTNGYPLVANSAISTGLQYAQLGTAGIANGAVTPAKLEDLGQGTLLGRQYGAGTGDPSGLDGADITKIGTGGSAGSTESTKYFAALASGGSTVVGRHTMSWINGWITSYAYASFV